jgi:BirA family biotin operon repressor/biotin-[acetyl-CoA-carboxylase] ligase
MREEVPAAVGRVLAETTSTNDEAARLAEAGAPEGTWVVADAQTAGRGRRGRVWVSPPGAGLYLSVVFRPDSQESQAGGGDAAIPVLTLMAGVAVVEAVSRAAGVRAMLKWPNDVVIEGAAGKGGPARRKLAGILAEASTTAGALQHVIVGIGVNVRRAAYPPDVAGRAIALEEVAGRAIDRDAVRDAILTALMTWRGRVRVTGVAPLFDAWKNLAPSSQGHPVSWGPADGRRSGWTAGLDDDGALLVRTPSGVERILAGELTWE